MLKETDMHVTDGLPVGEVLSSDCDFAPYDRFVDSFVVSPGVERHDFTVDVTENALVHRMRLAFPLLAVPSIALMCCIIIAGDTMLFSEWTNPVIDFMRERSSNEAWIFVFAVLFAVCFMICVVSYHCLSSGLKPVTEADRFSLVSVPGSYFDVTTTRSLQGVSHSVTWRKDVVAGLPRDVAEAFKGGPCSSKEAMLLSESAKQDKVVLLAFVDGELRLRYGYAWRENRKFKTVTIGGVKLPVKDGYFYIPNVLKPSCARHAS